METPPLFYKVLFGLLDCISFEDKKELLSRYNSVEEAFQSATLQDFKLKQYKNVTVKEYIANNKLQEKAQQELEFIDKFNVKTYFFADENYPYRLLEMADSPAMIYGLGEMDFNQAHFLTVVGTRDASDLGAEFCNYLIDELKKRDKNVVIVSGLARGIDTFSHQAAMFNSLPTAAVVGHGLKKIYPEEHTDFARQITRQGGMVLSEYTSQTPIAKRNFVQRNRIMAGLSDATLVVEAPARSGSLITAQIAFDANRQVLSFCPRVNSPRFEGCKNLVEQDIAEPIRTVDDFLVATNW